MMRRTAATLVLLAMSGLGTSGQTSQAPQPSTLDERDAQSLNLTAYAELLRSDVRTQKVAILTEVMAFTEAEDKVFWPIYREYETEMATLGDERVALIADYARSYSTMTDDVAQTLATRALDLEAKRHAREGEVPRTVRQGAVAAHEPAVPAGRAPAAADHRSADLGRPAHRQVT